MWLVVGLGNPGEKYSKNRHNVGFMVIDAIAQKHRAFFQKSFSAEIAKVTVESESVFLLKPQTFMNRSGESVQAASSFHKTAPKNIIVVHDELDLPFGEVRIKMEGGHGGHNGLRDIIRALGAGFARVRVGVGRPQIKGLEADFVLKDYKSAEQEILAEQIVTAGEAVLAIVRDGVQKAQMIYNQKQSPLAKKV